MFKAFVFLTLSCAFLETQATSLNIAAVQDGVSHFEAARKLYLSSNEADIEIHTVLRHLVHLKEEALSKYPEISPEDFVAELNDRNLQATNGLCDVVADDVSEITQYSKWMSTLPPSTIITDITLPGSHDAGSFPLNTDFNKNSHAYRAVKEYIDALGEQVVAAIMCRFAQTQTLPISAQLNGGMRYLDLRVDFDDPTQTYRVHHTLFGETIDIVLNTIATFLEAQPTEILVLEMTQMWSKTVTEAQRLELKDLIIAVLGQYLYPPTASSTIEASIGEMVASNQRVVLAVQDELIASHSSIWTLEAGIHNTHSGTTVVPEMVAFNKERVAEFNSGYLPSAFYLISWTLTPDTEYITSNIGDGQGIYTLATAGNEAFPDFMSDVTLEALPHIVIIDFFEHTPFMSLLGLTADDVDSTASPTDGSLGNNSTDSSEIEDPTPQTLGNSGALTFERGTLVLVALIQALLLFL